MYVDHFQDLPEEVLSSWNEDGIVSPYGLPVISKPKVYVKLKKQDYTSLVCPLQDPVRHSDREIARITYDCFLNIGFHQINQTISPSST